MDICLVLAELDPKAIENGLKRAKEYLFRFSFIEDESEEYKSTISVAAQHWKEFAKTGFQGNLSMLARQPYQWMRLAGEIEIEDNNYGVELFLYPISGTVACVTISFSSTLYDAMYSFKPSYLKEVDLNVKADVMGLLHLLVISFSAKAFALRQLTSVEELVLPVRASDIMEWLIAPNEDLIRLWKFKLVGIQSALVELHKVTDKWPTERLGESSYGYLIYDGFV